MHQQVATDQIEKQKESIGYWTNLGQKFKAGKGFEHNFVVKVRLPRNEATDTWLCIIAENHEVTKKVWKTCNHVTLRNATFMFIYSVIDFAI